ncbi:MAG: DUF3991 and toprim domain-containing protein, partial [Clostridiales bacterium]|nr:DUF3991 and toprim domain-containing protein [Clostridiales bacterium]
MGYTRQELKKARITNLYDYLINNYSDSFKLEGNSLRFLENKSISIRSDYCGYYDFANDEKGNSVDFLVRHMGYSVVDAVKELCYSDCNVCNDDGMITTLPDNFPEPTLERPKQMFAYLKGRGIPYNITQLLVDKDLLYQSKQYNNCVFINKDKDWCEIRGTLTYGTPYHQTLSDGIDDGYWSFTEAEDADIAYICEGAIDAISLYLINQQQGITTPALYISIGGVNKQPAIDRIKNTIWTVIVSLGILRARGLS